MTKYQNYSIKLIGALFGAIIGYIYWYFIGCQDGCTIQSVWWRMSLWASVVAYLLASMLLDYYNNKNKQNE